MIEIYAVGGYGEVGKNMTAIKVGEEVLLLDMGLHLPNYIKYTEEEEAELKKLTRKELIKVEAVPNDESINELRERVVAIICSHAHLDHIGAIPYLASRYNAPIICTPFAASVIKQILRDQEIKISNEIIPINANHSIKISKETTIEFVNITHSTPQSVVVAIHTKEGIILYTNDFKLDNTPILGKKPNYERLEELSKKEIKIAIIDSLYAYDERKTASESVAREMLKDSLLGVDNKGKAIIVTTFSSHIARIKSIIEYAKQLQRKVIILGRSLAKYCYAAEESQIYFASKEAEIIKYSKKVAKKLMQIQKTKDKYLIIMTGHQGEPKAILSRIANGKLPFKLSPEDNIIFSCNVIPTNVNMHHREILEEKLKTYGVRIFKGIHVSGHGAKEDIRELLKIIKAKHLIPSHSEKPTIEKFTELAKELGYKQEYIHELITGQKISITM